MSKTNGSRSSAVAAALVAGRLQLDRPATSKSATNVGASVGRPRSASWSAA